jgi:hypothetical protein
VLKKRNIYLYNAWQNRNTRGEILFFGILMCATSKADTIILVRLLPKLNENAG